MAVVAWLSFLFGLAAAFYQGGVAAKGSELRTKLIKFATDLSKALDRNNALKERFITAYQEKNSKLLQSLIYGMGFGARSDSLRREISKNEVVYQEGLMKFNQRNTDINAAINEINGHMGNTGASITGNDEIEERVIPNKGQEWEKLASESADVGDLSQNIQGGTL